MYGVTITKINGNYFTEVINYMRAHSIYTEYQRGCIEFTIDDSKFNKDERHYDVPQEDMVNGWSCYLLEDVFLFIKQENGNLIQVPTYLFAIPSNECYGITLYIDFIYDEYVNFREKYTATNQINDNTSYILAYAYGD